MDELNFNKELIDYLYGEMISSEKIAFEEKLKNDKELRQEYESMLDTRNHLAQLKDKDVMEPLSIWEHTRSGWVGRNLSKRPLILRPIIAVAASLLIFLVAGFLTNFNIKIDSNGFFMGFSAASDQTEVYTKEEVKTIVENAILENNNSILARMEDSNQGLDSRLVSLEENIHEDKDDNMMLTNSQLKMQLADMENKNVKLFGDYLKLTNDQQQEYFKSMFTQFHEFLQQQRTEDLNMIRTSIIELQQSQTIQKQETDQAIASIISTVNNN